MNVKASTSNISMFLLKNMSFVLFVSIFVMFGIFFPRFLSYENLENIMGQSAYIGILAVGMTFVLLTAGIDLSVGSIMYLATITAGLLMNRYQIPVWLALLASVLVGAMFGAFNAFLITKLKIIPFIVTLGTMVAGRGIGLLITRSRGVMYEDEFTDLSTYQVLSIIPLPIFVFGCVIVVAFIFLTKTQTGRQIYAVGADIDGAKKAGLRTNRMLAYTYILCGICAALAGFVASTQFGIITAGFGSGDEFDAIAASVLGGTSLFGGVGGVFPGTLLGTVLIQMVQAGLVFSKIDLYLQPMIMALIIFFAVFLDGLRNIIIKRMQRRNIMSLE